MIRLPSPSPFIVATTAQTVGEEPASKQPEAPRSETPEGLAQGLALRAQKLGDVPQQVRAVVERMRRESPQESAQVLQALLDLKTGATTAKEAQVQLALEALPAGDLQTLLKYLQVNLGRQGRLTERGSKLRLAPGASAEATAGATGLLMQDPRYVRTDIALLAKLATATTTMDPAAAERLAGLQGRADAAERRLAELAGALAGLEDGSRKLAALGDDLGGTEVLLARSKDLPAQRRRLRSLQSELAAAIAPADAAIRAAPSSFGGATSALELLKVPTDELSPGAVRTQAAVARIIATRSGDASELQSLQRTIQNLEEEERTFSERKQNLDAIFVEQRTALTALLPPSLRVAALAAPDISSVTRLVAQGTSELRQEVETLRAQAAALRREATRAELEHAQQSLDALPSARRAELLGQCLSAKNPALLREAFDPEVRPTLSVDAAMPEFFVSASLSKAFEPSQIAAAILEVAEGAGQSLSQEEKARVLSGVRMAHAERTMGSLSAELRPAKERLLSLEQRLSALSQAKVPPTSGALDHLAKLRGVTDASLIRRFFAAPDPTDPQLWVASDGSLTARDLQTVNLSIAAGRTRAAIAELVAEEVSAVLEPLRAAKRWDLGESQTRDRRYAQAIELLGHLRATGMPMTESSAQGIVSAVTRAIRLEMDGVRRTWRNEGNKSNRTAALESMIANLESLTTGEPELAAVAQMARWVSSSPRSKPVVDGHLNATTKEMASLLLAEAELAAGLRREHGVNTYSREQGRYAMYAALDTLRSEHERELNKHRAALGSVQGSRELRWSTLKQQASAPLESAAAELRETVAPLEAQLAALTASAEQARVRWASS